MNIGILNHKGPLKEADDFIEDIQAMLQLRSRRGNVKFKIRWFK
jgi:hypothetical protein